MQHYRREGTIWGAVFGVLVVGGPGARLTKVAGDLRVANLLLEVVLRCLHLADLPGGHSAHVAHPRRVGRDEQEKLARAGQLVAPLIHAHRKLVEPVPPPILQKVVRGRRVGAQAQAAAHHVLRGERDHPPRQWIHAPGLQRHLQRFFAVVGQAVTFVLRGARAEQKGIVGLF